MRKIISILTSISFCGAILLVLVGTGTIQVQAQKAAKPQPEDKTEPTVRTDLVVAPKLTADTLADIKRAGKLRVGVSRTVPWAFHSAYDDGKLMGFEIDLGRKMARDLGVEVEFFVEPFHLLIPDLIAGRFDVIMSGMSITPERAMRVNFSNPYATSKLMLASSVAKSKGMNTPEAFNKQERSESSRDRLEPKLQQEYLIRPRYGCSTMTRRCFTHSLRARSTLRSRIVQGLSTSLRYSPGYWRYLSKSLWERTRPLLPREGVIWILSTS